MDAGQVRKIEQQNEALRRRNGELFLALQEHCPDVADSLTPIADWQTQYQVVDRLISLAVEYAFTRDRETLNELDLAVASYQNYWNEVQAEREKRTLATLKARKRREALLLTQNA